MCLQPKAVKDIVSSPRPSYCIASVVSSFTGCSPVAATAAVSTSPTLATELHSQEVTGTSSAHAITASSTRAITSAVQAVSSPTRIVASVSTLSIRKYSRDDKRFTLPEEFCSSKKIFCTRHKTPPNCILVAPPIQGAVCSGRNTYRVATLPPAGSIIYTLSMQVLLYISFFLYWLGGGFLPKWF